MHTTSEILLQRIASDFEPEKEKVSQALYISLYKHIKARIQSQDLPEGSLLPSTRSLAAYLSVSRSTVIKAYELLKQEAYLLSKMGSGYVIMGVDREEGDEKAKGAQPYAYPEISKTGKSFLRNLDLINPTSDKSIAFRPGLPPLDMFPVNQWKNLTNLYWRHIKSSTLSYSPSSGIVPLKKSIAAYLNISRGLKCDFRQVVIVSGSLQSLYLLGNVLIDPGDGVVLENPTFPNVHSIFRSLRAHIHPVNIEAGGIQLPEAWGQKPSPKAIHTTPSHHYPSGVRMSLARRQALLAWAYRHLSFIIENDYEHEISNWHDPIPSLFSLDTQDRVIYLGTFNRLLHPSVRLGYMVVPFYLLPAVEALQKHSHRFVSPSLQIVMNQFIEKKYLYAHVKNVVGAAEERKALFEKLFEELFQGEMELVPREADSLYLLARFRRRMKDKDLVRMLEQGNIIAHAYSKCFIDGQPEDGLILGYASVRNPVIRKTLSQMHRLWREAGL